MRKKHKIYQSPTVKIEPLPKAFVASVSVSNLQEQKARFLKHGKTPIFVVEGDRSTVEELTAKSSGKIRFDLLGEAEYILNTVKQKYGKGENYLEHIYGPRIEQNEANEILFDYIRENSLQESLAVYWSNDMPCSARMTWKGYSFKCNRPEARRYALWLNGTYENPYLRRHGLRCLLDHEIGTHFYRSYNDGFQPWFYDRKKFGLRSVGSFESLCTEEGLAAINTTLRAREKYLWLSALTYYTACKSTEMTFKQLFDHLGQFVDNPEQRWKHVMRVKRGLVDPNDLGGYGKDQCYFEGAVTVLRNIDDINFNLLMSGKICYDEVSRVKRMARLGSVCLPAIMRDMDSYRKQLQKMAVINGLHLSHPMHEPSKAYVERLKERQSGTRRKRKVRKGKKARSSPSKVSGLQSQESKTSLEAGSRSDPSQPVDSEAGSDVSLQDHNSNTDVRSCGSSVKHSSSVTADYDSCTEPGLEAPACRGSMGHRDPECSHSSTHTTSWQFQVPIRIKNRPHTASGLPRCRLPPLHQTNSSDKLTGDSKENSFHMQEGTSAVWFGGLCNICGDSSSLDDLSHCGEELGAWLTCLLPSTPSPSPSVPPLSLPTLSQGEKSGVKGLASSAREKASHDSLTPNLQPRSAGRTGFSYAKPPLPRQP